MPSSRQHIEVHRTLDRDESREAALVLYARRIPYVEVVEGRAIVLAVPMQHYDKAVAELDSYEEENRDWPPMQEEIVMLASGKHASLFYAIALVAVFLLEREGAFGLPWHEAGRAHAGGILSGEWWRNMTSLTLHADLLHLASNLLFGILFLVFVSHVLGTGVGLLATLLAGVVGTLLNAIIQDPGHLSVGASTSVFGAVGIFMGFLWSDRRRRRYSPLYIWSPVLLGVFFLGSHGMGGDNTDVMAHATGFGAGLAIGAILGRFGSELFVGRELQLASGIFAALLLVAAWVGAFLGAGS